MASPGKDIIEGLEDALAYAKGDKSRARISPVHIPGTINVLRKLNSCPRTKRRNRLAQNCLFTYEIHWLAQGGSYSVTFNQEGQFPYFCRIHAGEMMGTITVSQ